MDDGCGAVDAPGGAAAGDARELVERLEEAAASRSPGDMARAADAVASCVERRGSIVGRHLRAGGATAILTLMTAAAARGAAAGGAWEAALDSASRALSALASDGPPAAHARVRRDFTIDGVRVSLFELGADQLGARVWTSSLYLCLYLLRTGALPGPGEEAPGRDLLEIGSGVGLVGLLASARGGFRKVVLSDNDEALLENLRLSAALNAQPGSTPIEVRALDWAAGPARGRADRFDVVLGADVIYDETHPGLVARVLSATLRPGGEAIVAVAVREAALRLEFIAQLALCGVAVVEEVDPVAVAGIDEGSVLAACGVDWSDMNEGTLLPQSAYAGGVRVFHLAPERL